MTEFERKLLDLIREAMRQGSEPMQRRIIDLEKNVFIRIESLEARLQASEKKILDIIEK